MLRKREGEREGERESEREREKEGEENRCIAQANSNQHIL